MGGGRGRVAVIVDGAAGEAVRATESEAAERAVADGLASCFKALSKKPAHHFKMFLSDWHAALHDALNGTQLVNRAVQVAMSPGLQQPTAVLE